MNQNGEYFAGFQYGYFKWSLDYSQARTLERVEQCEFIKKYEPLMEIIYDYA